MSNLFKRSDAHAPSDTKFEQTAEAGDHYTASGEIDQRDFYHLYDTENVQYYDPLSGERVRKNMFSFIIQSKHSKLCFNLKTVILKLFHVPNLFIYDIVILLRSSCAHWFFARANY